MAFQIATKYSCEEAYNGADPTILEPIMDVEVTVPSEYQAGVMGQLVKRRGNVTNTQTRQNLFILNADVPLSEKRAASHGYGQSVVRAGVPCGWLPG